MGAPPAATSPEDAPPRPVTLATVARRAGVSLGTASRALNASYGVHAETRRHVEAVARDLGYAMNRVARSLMTGRTDTIGVLSSDLDHVWNAAIIRGIERALRRMSSSLILLSNAARGDDEALDDNVRDLVSRRIDGIILLADGREPRPPVRGAGGIPVVYLCGPSTDPRDASVLIDNEHAGFVAADHLVARGCTRVAHLPGPREYPVWAERIAGVERALAAHGLSVVNDTDCAMWDGNGGWTGVPTLLDAGVAFDGLVAANDDAARQAIEQLQSRGIRVPDDVRVVGFDNVEASRDIHPTLTSVEMDLLRVGEVAVETLLDLQDGRPRPGIVAVPGRLVVGESA